MSPNFVNAFKRIGHQLIVIGSMYASAPGFAAERIVLDEATWEGSVPEGKEVDCIYGDIVLRNDRIMAVIANPAPGRHANMTTKEIGGGVIDLTSRLPSNDQLTVFYPGAGQFAWREVAAFGTNGDVTSTGQEVTYTCRTEIVPEQPVGELVYRLRDGDSFLSIETRFHNPHAAAVRFSMQDAVRADRSFRFDFREYARQFIAQDEWWLQAYSLIATDRTPVPVGDSVSKGRPVMEYQLGGTAEIRLEPGGTVVLQRRLFVAANELELRGRIDEAEGRNGHSVQVTIQDVHGPVWLAHVELTQNGQRLGFGRTDRQGQLQMGLPEGDYELQVTALGRAAVKQSLQVAENTTVTVDVEQPGYVEGKITDAHGEAIPCKVEFRGSDGTPDPNFGPDTFEEDVRNLVYTPQGTFRQELPPGRYDVLVSHGPEYDAMSAAIDVQRGQVTTLQLGLRRSVETPGWVSSDFHSHSTPSGDNTSSQRGRVLNLLAEHLEFAPCTEHNRISTYAPDLRELSSEHRMATCSGIELTGRPLPVNHQNAFPLEFKPRRQDGGGPAPDENPVVQIERLALWDRRATKVVQGNHPNLMQILGDRDLDGQSDGGFERMLGAMDVVEVHPPAAILQFPTSPPPADESGNVIYDWLRLLNQGYRVPGVVNTDAHYNFHGSGFLRNYLKSPADEPHRILTADMIQAAERGQMIMTNGPFLEVACISQVEGRQRTAGPGDDLIAPQGQATLHVRVQCANWLDVNRVLVFVNGRPSSELDFRRSTHSPRFTSGVVKFDQHIPLHLERDAHVVVVAAGEGLTLGPVVGPDHQNDIPVAVANPIFLDVDANGFQPNGDTLDLPVPLAKD